MNEVFTVRMYESSCLFANVCNVSMYYVSINVFSIQVQGWSMLNLMTDIQTEIQPLKRKKKYLKISRV